MDHARLVAVLAHLDVMTLDVSGALQVSLPAYAQRFRAQPPD